MEQPETPIDPTIIPILEMSIDDPQRALEAPSRLVYSEGGSSLSIKVLKVPLHLRVGFHGGADVSPVLVIEAGGPINYDSIQASIEVIRVVGKDFAERYPVSLPYIIVEARDVSIKVNSVFELISGVKRSLEPAAAIMDSGIITLYVVPPQNQLMDTMTRLLANQLATTNRGGRDRPQAGLRIEVVDSVEQALGYLMHGKET